MKRIPASEMTRKKLSDLIQGQGEDFSQSEFLRLAARLILEEGLEAEATEALGRDRYERGSGQGYRNGYRRGVLKTAEGALEFMVPQVSDRATPFESKLRAQLAGRTEELDRLAVEMYARGLSTRDIEKTFSDTSGQLLISKSAVSQITEVLWEQYLAFSSRDLSEYKVLYLFVDGIAEKLHLGQPREAVLVAWGILEDGEKILLHIAPGTKEDTQSCRDFFHDLRSRGLPDPICVITDGAPGLIRAVEECFPRSLRQRCLAHKMRNLENKVPLDIWQELKVEARSCYQAASPAQARLLMEHITQKYQDVYPSFMKCFLDDFEACIAHLRLPVTHRRITRTTNLLERLFLEERRRTKAIVHAFREKAILKLMYAALIRAAESWRGVKMTAFELRQLEQVRKELNDKVNEQNKPIPQTKNNPQRKSTLKHFSSKN